MSKHTQAIANYKSKLLDRISNVNPSLANDLREIKLDWYRFRNVAGEAGDDDTKAELFIYDEIGGSFGVSADEFVRELTDITATEIDVRINSPGGSLFDSIAIYNALVKHPAKVTTYVDALAASGASIIAMAGDEVVMMLGAQMMIHDALGVEIGNERDMLAMSKFLGRQSSNIATIYAEKAGGTEAEWRERMLAETWMFASEAVEIGLADRVYKADKSDDAEADDADDDEDLDVTDSNNVDIVALMNRTHTLRNRDYKYPGRRNAPDPVIDKHEDENVATNGLGELVSTFRNSLRKGY